MTQDKDFKALVRERMQRTGESYVTARRHLLGERGEPAPSVPTGWFITGQDNESYEFALAADVQHNGRPAAYLRYVDDGDGAQRWAAAMQYVQTTQYAGTRLRLSAAIRTEDVSEWAGLWLRADAAGKTLTIDNMRDPVRTVAGTTDWSRMECVIDIPHSTEAIGFGAMMGGTGRVLVADFQLDVVDESVPVTGGTRMNLGAPRNLDFSEGPG
jgi:hypothetical protein